MAGRREYALGGLHCAGCAAEIEAQIKALPSVSRADLNFGAGTLTVEADGAEPGAVTAALKELIAEIEPGVTVREKTPTQAPRHVYRLTNLDCAHCAAKIEAAVRELPGVEDAALAFMTRELRVGSRRDPAVLEGEIRRVVARFEPVVTVVRADREKDAAPAAETGGKGSLYRLGLGVLVYFAALVLPLPAAVQIGFFSLSYLLTGGGVLLRAVRNLARGQFLDENFLMAVATVGAFAIREYPEGVAVMLFYQIGEMFQAAAVDRSRRSIRALLDIRPDYANLEQDGAIVRVSPEAVAVGAAIIVRPGEKVPLDGIIRTGTSFVDTSALTGESVPRAVGPGDEILGGSINAGGVLLATVTREYSDSAVAKILDLVQNAGSKKAPTENFITKFARYYTPAVVGIAAALAVIPPLVLPGADFAEWLYRGLVFLVISCPCALVISIPLGFFGGLGGASRRGILIKGGNYLEALNDVDTVVFDKTGTLTRGVFKVTAVVPAPGMTRENLLAAAALAEAHSGHPIAKSIREAYDGEIPPVKVTAYEDVAGQGVRAMTEEGTILAGSRALLEQAGVSLAAAEPAGTIVHVAVNGSYAGHLLIADEIKADSAAAVRELRRRGVKRVLMLTGDSPAVAARVAGKLALDGYFAGLLPHEKVAKLEEIAGTKGKGHLIFVGDGINDAPVLARADVGVAMGGLGSDAAIEAADVVIMTDEPSKLAEAMRLAGRTRAIVWQNIILTLTVKGAVLALGAGGIATLWEAVFADVGVAVLAILNAMRVLRPGKAE